MDGRVVHTSNSNCAFNGFVTAASCCPTAFPTVANRWYRRAPGCPVASLSSKRRPWSRAWDPCTRPSVPAHRPPRAPRTGGNHEGGAVHAVLGVALRGPVAAVLQGAVLDVPGVSCDEEKSEAGESGSGCAGAGPAGVHSPFSDYPPTAVGCPPAAVG